MSGKERITKMSRAKYKQKKKSFTFKKIICVEQYNWTFFLKKNSDGRVIFWVYGTHFGTYLDIIFTFFKIIFFIFQIQFSIFLTQNKNTF